MLPATASTVIDASHLSADARPGTALGAAADADSDARQWITVQVAPTRVVRVLIGGALLLLVAHLAVLMASVGVALDDAPGFVKMLHLDGEKNVPALFSTALLAFNGVLFALWARAAVGGSARTWMLCAAVFGFLAMDEFFSIHERLAAPLRAAFGLTGALHYAWVVPYLLGTAVLAGVCLPALWRLSRALQGRLALAALLYVSGAAGMQMVAGAAMEATGGSRAGWVWLTCVTLEESLEIAGLIALVAALLRPLSAHPGVVLLLGQRDAG